MIKILSLSPFDSRLPIKCKLYIYNGIIANKQIGVRGKDATLKQTWESWKLIQGEYFVIVFKVSQNNFKELVKENEGTREMVQPGKHLPRLQSSCVWTYSTYVRKDECNIMCLSFRYGGGIENHAFLELAGHLAYTSWVLGPVESTVSKNKWLRDALSISDAHQLRAFIAAAENWGSVFSTYMAAHLSTRISDIFLWPQCVPETDMVHIYKVRRNTHTCKW